MSSCVGLLVAPFSVGDSWVQAAPDDLWCSRATQSGFDAGKCGSIVRSRVSPICFHTLD